MKKEKKKGLQLPKRLPSYDSLRRQLDILKDYVETQSMALTARRFGVTREYVRQIVEKERQGYFRKRYVKLILSTGRKLDKENQVV